MEFTAVDFDNLRKLISRVPLQGLDEAKVAVVLEHKLIEAANVLNEAQQKESDGDELPTAD